MSRGTADSPPIVLVRDRYGEEVFTWASLVTPDLTIIR